MKAKNNPVAIRLSDYEKKRLDIVCKEFERNQTETIREALKTSLDRTFREYPLLKAKIK